MGVAELIAGYATGMVFTRRTGPLGGAGFLALFLPLCLWYCGAPLTVAVAGVFAYRILTLWLPMPLALAFLPTLRAMGEQQVSGGAFLVRGAVGGGGWLAGGVRRAPSCYVPVCRRTWTDRRSPDVTVRAW
jgi:hypothetical protein